eukprot:TRINITY_DN81825_c0_g1_i1.p1 TRINITY_DN81825_c0_g1~~TRINITY_DN81825_c0_g1_i1.p1  ORF type:complete len:116 (+),score=23.70 TRINITY_DN81825_c0_g1_i1:56-403(+)
MKMQNKKSISKRRRCVVECSAHCEKHKSSKARTGEQGNIIMWGCTQLTQPNADKNKQTRATHRFSTETLNDNLTHCKWTTDDDDDISQTVSTENGIQMGDTNYDDHWIRVMLGEV